MNAELYITSMIPVKNKVIVYYNYGFNYNKIIIFDYYDFELASDEQIEKAIINYFMDRY